MEFNGTFLASIISFLVFVLLMNKILYAPMEKIVKQRQDFIDGNINQADENYQKADELSNEREEKLVDAKNDARVKYLEAVEEFKTEKDNIVKNAQEVSNNELENSYRELQQVSDSTKGELKNRMTDLANDIVEKVLGYRSEVQGFDNETVDKILFH